MPTVSFIFHSNVCRSSIFMLSSGFSSSYLCWRRSSLTRSSAFVSLFSLYFSSFILIWSPSIGASFSRTSISYLLHHSSTCSVLLSFFNIRSWTLLSSCSVLQTVLQMFSDVFPVPLSYLVGAVNDTHFWLF